MERDINVNIKYENYKIIEPMMRDKYNKDRKISEKMANLIDKKFPLYPTCKV